jgi:hypothetical protein
VFDVEVQLESSVHCTQEPALVLQTGVPPVHFVEFPDVHWVHWPSSPPERLHAGKLALSQPPPEPSPVQAMHVSYAGSAEVRSHLGLLPEQLVSLVQATQLLVDVSHAGFAPVQSTASPLEHWPHEPSDSQAGNSALSQPPDEPLVVHLMQVS